jgi:thiol-disulfide isomerase/thioredoxin
MRTRTALLLLAAAALVAGCGSATRDEQAAAPAPDTTAAAAAVAAGDTTGAALVLQPIEANGVLALTRDGRAKATVVNVWASWCAPCREEFPELRDAVRARAADGVRLVLVSADFDEQLPDVRKFLAAHGVGDTTYLKHDADQRFIDTLNPAWSGSLPATLVFDATGKRVAFHEGRGTRAWFDQAITQALSSGAAQRRPS